MICKSGSNSPKCMEMFLAVMESKYTNDMFI